MRTEAPIWLVWLVAFAQGLAFGMWLGVYLARQLAREAHRRAAEEHGGL